MWSIPSKQDYPADATQQMAEAATAPDRSQDPARRRRNGRVARGVRRRRPAVGQARLQERGRRHARDHDRRRRQDARRHDHRQDGQRTPRASATSASSNQDVVYIVELDPDEPVDRLRRLDRRRLLKLNPFDIRKVFINDYSADLSFGMTADGRLAPQRQLGSPRRDHARLRQRRRQVDSSPT